MKRLKFGKQIKDHTDVLITVVVLALGSLIVYEMLTFFGVSLMYIIPIFGIYYKLIAASSLLFAVVVISADNQRNKYIISNYALLIFYILTIGFITAFIIESIVHFNLTFDQVFNNLKQLYNFPLLTRMLFFFIFISQMLVAGLFVITLMARTRGIGNNIIKKIHYGNYYSNILDYLYGDKVTQDSSLILLRDYMKKTLAKKGFVDTLNMFNQNFKGEFKLRTHDLFFELGLEKFVRKRLSSPSIKKNIWAIKILSSFNDTNSTELLKNRLELSPNPFVSFESLIGLIRLNQLDYVLDYLHKIKDPIVDFDIIKIIATIKLQSHSVKDFSRLLSSPNEGVVVLGIHLINEYHQEEYIPQIKALLLHSSLRVVRAAHHALMNLDYIDYELHIVEALSRATGECKLELLHAIQPYFTEDSLVWARDLLISEQELEVKVLVLNMMKSVISRKEIILNMFDGPQKLEVLALFENRIKGGVYGS